MSRMFFALALLSLSACASVPATLDPGLFATEMARHDDNPSIAAADAEMTRLLARTDLTDLQRADVLFSRAERRLDSKFDLPGAIFDYEAFTRLAPEDPRSIMAERRNLFASGEIENAQRRLARLQNLSNWFDDKVLMGDLDAAAARYRSSGLTPNAAHLYLLREAGFVCGIDTVELATPDTVHRFGAAPEYATGSVWCDDPSLT